jgi:hypothetical protein
MANILRTATTVKISDMITNATSEFNLRTSGLSTQYLDDNIVHHYIDFLFDGAYFCTFTDVEKAVYNLDPKRLSKVIFGTTDLFFVIMAMNNFRDYADMDLFSLGGIYVPADARLAFLTNLIEKKIVSGMVLMDYDEEA